MDDNCNVSSSNSSFSCSNSITSGYASNFSATNADTDSATRPCKLDICDNYKLNYTVHRYSSFSTTYFPENILINRPRDQSSRWSAFSNTPPQYLTLRLHRPAIVRQIKFGKFEKSHVCNIKKFRIFGGLEENNLILLLEAGLKNDNVSETFDLLCKTADGCNEFPILYLKIVPLLSWGPTFNFTIWYVELIGQDDLMLTADKMVEYNARRENEIVRLCLKHFRQQGYTEAYDALLRQTQVQLEHPLVTELHELLVDNGDFVKTENFLEYCIAEGLMDNYLQRQDYKHRWVMQHSQSCEQPGNRGGHQLVMDSKKRLIYLFGGWDGFQDLGDFWMFDLEKPRWVLLCEYSHMINGPSPRSCHKMVFDPVSQNIFMLGRYLDNSIRTRDYIKSDFYLYDTRAACWMLICDDTSQEGGPQLVYDHQMCIDADKRTIYVFGGKVLTPRSVTTAAALNETEYSGLFSYHIDTNTWTQILVDCHHPSASEADVLSIKSCISHCMVFHTKNRKLYIYGGQRGKEDIQEFITYDVDTQSIDIINKGDHMGFLITGCNGQAHDEPPPGYTSRATIDIDREEIYVFTSLSKVKDRVPQHVDAFNSFWVYSIGSCRWSRVYSYRHSLENGKPDPTEPCPRFAHQLIYDDASKVHYLFGGNPGKTKLPALRLGDFWTLVLEKPKRQEILQHCRFLLRKLRYKEIARMDPIKAMHYLRTKVAEVVDHSDPSQLNDFHKLAALMFEPTTTYKEKLPNNNNEKDETADMPESEDSSSSCSIPSSASCSWHKTINPQLSNHEREEQRRRLQRSYLFNRFIQLLPLEMGPPERNIADFVVL